MGANVFANGREISAIADSNKSIAAMPDVCLSPPSPPAGPIPIPYPNFSDSSKTDSGSKKVKIGNKEAGLKNKSVYKNSKGDEAATRSFGMGVVTHTLSGATKHAAWSFDVKIEGENAIRFLDLTTHNHSSDPMNSGSTTVDIAKAKIAAGKPLNCEELEIMNQEARSDKNMRPSGKNKGFTATTASFTPPGGGRNTFMQAMTRQAFIRSGSREGFASPRPANQCIACSSEKWGAGGSNNHTEPKLMEQIFERAGNPTSPGPPGSLGSMTMRIHWKKKNRKNPMPDPCPRCLKGICKAIECGLEIKLCMNGDPPKDPPCENA